MKTIKKLKTRIGYLPSIRSRHPSHRVFRGTLGYFPRRSVIRLGSTTQLNDGVNRVEINSVDSINNSASKLRMKRCFRNGNVKTAEWIEGNAGNQAIIAWAKDKFPVIAKGIFGSRGQANTKIDTPQNLQSFLNSRSSKDYVFEKFFDGSREYRFHVSTLGVFLTWRKLRRNNTPENQRWFFNNENCNWVSEQHELYNRPSTYNQVCTECLKALNSVGLDVGACDVRMDKKGNFIIIEINSAPSMAEQTATAYKAEFKKLITNKIR